MLRYLYLASFVQICFGQAVTMIDESLPRQVELYSTQRISCDISGTLSTGIVWIRPDSFSVSTCASATNCVPNAGYSNPVANATRNVLEIENTTALDGGLWTCRDGAPGGQGSTGDLVVIKNSSECATNSTSKLNNLKERSQVTLMVYIKQYYCSSDELFQLGDDNVTLSRTTAGLDDNEGNVTLSVKRTETLNLYMVCGGFRLEQNCGANITIGSSACRLMSPWSLEISLIVIAGLLYF